MTPGRRFEDLGIDSLGLVESIFAIEEAFDIQVPFNANEPVAERLRHLVGGGRSSRRSRGWWKSSRRMRRVVITGAGTINALGQDVARHA